MEVCLGGGALKVAKTSVTPLEVCTMKRGNLDSTVGSLEVDRVHCSLLELGGKKKSEAPPRTDGHDIRLVTFS